jgi:hypothetical protein
MKTRGLQELTTSLGKAGRRNSRRLEGPPYFGRAFDRTPHIQKQNCGNAYTYSLAQALSDLHIVEGLK